MENLPEYIEGIPTNKKAAKERVALIKSYYEKLWKQLQRAGRVNRVFNGFLGVDIFIVEKESDKKTIYAASKNWQSTFAVKHLSEVVAKAKKFDDGPIYDKPKGNTQKANGYKNIVILHYKFINEEHPYLNFVAKLTIGINKKNRTLHYLTTKRFGMCTVTCYKDTTFF